MLFESLVVSKIEWKYTTTTVFRWEDEVIWDSTNMPRKLHPNIVSLDPNDDNIIIAIPDDIDPDTLPNEEPARYSYHSFRTSSYGF